MRLQGFIYSEASSFHIDKNFVLRNFKLNLIDNEAEHKSEVINVRSIEYSLSCCFNWYAKGIPKGRSYIPSLLIEFSFSIQIEYPVRITSKNFYFVLVLM